MKISKLIEGCEPAELSLIKRFNLESFKNSEATLSLAIEKWLSENLFSVLETRKKSFAALFTHFEESTAPNWWNKLLDDKINSYLANIDAESAMVVFNWVQFDFEIFRKIESVIAITKKSEQHFCTLLSEKIDPSNFSALKKFALKRGWYKFHATILTLEFPFKKAISEQLKVDTALSSLEGIDIILKGVKPRAIIDFTVLNGDERLLTIAGKLCYEDSSYLETLDFTNIYWQKIWLNSMIRGNSINDSFKEPQNKIFTLFNTLLDGNSINEKLLEIVAESEFGNLLTYPKREDLWSKLSITLQTKFLKKTASVLLETLSRDSTTEVPCDPIFSSYVLKHAINDFLYYNRSNIKSVLPIFNKFNQISEGTFRDYINNYTSNIDVIDATQLGELVNSRRYSNVASVIYRKSNLHNNWRVALKECYLLLNGFTQLSIAWNGLIKDVKITEDQWWNALSEIAYKLYSGGPKENKIWLEADGEEYDLLTTGTGKELWIAALKKLRNGGCSGITVEKLLKKMMKEHKRNEGLRTLNHLKNKI